MAEVRLTGVNKHYAGVQALHGISLTIEDGEFAVFVGPSGCGKSTLLRSIAGLEDISGGQIRIGDRDVTQAAPSERDVAMVFQSYALYPHMTVRENMDFGMKVNNFAPADRQRRIAEAARILQLEPYLDRKPAHLSGGQRQRVAIGRAIVKNPAVFLFDEPLSNLDAKLRVQMRTEIKELHQRLKTTTVYVTHDQIEAMTMADQIVVMQGGRIEQVGAPLELYDRPANAFVAAFIGSPSMNLLEGRITGGMVDVGGTRLPLPAGVASDEGREVIYGIRPEHLHEAAEGVTGKVAVIEPTGSETHVVVRLAGRELTAVFRNRVAFAPGATITLAPDSDASHLFDKATGQRI